MRLSAKFFIITLGIVLNACGGDLSEKITSTATTLENERSDSPTVLSLEVYEELESALKASSVEVNSYNIPDVLYELNNEEAYYFFAKYFDTHPMTKALNVNLGYPVFHWGDNNASLQNGVSTVLLREVTDFFSAHRNLNSISSAFAKDSALQEHVFSSLVFLSKLRNSAHVDAELKSKVFAELLFAIGQTSLGSMSYIQPDRFPFVNPVKSQLIMTALSLANGKTESERITEVLTLDAHRMKLYQDHQILVLDNQGFDSMQLSAIDAFISLVPERLRVPAIVTCFDCQIGSHKDPRFTVHDLRGEAVFNLWNIRVGAEAGTQFPDDWRSLEADVFTVVLAHEYNHLVDGKHLQSDTVLSTFRKRVLKAAGTDGENYLRNMFEDGFFSKNPQELVASLANMYFTSSEDSFRLAMNRVADKNYNPLNQLILMASLYSDSNSVSFYKMDTTGEITAQTHPIRKDSGLISMLTIKGAEFHFIYDSGLIREVRTEKVR